MQPASPAVMNMQRKDGEQHNQLLSCKLDKNYNTTETDRINSNVYYELQKNSQLSSISLFKVFSPQPSACTGLIFIKVLAPDCCELTVIYCELYILHVRERKEV